MNHRLFKIWLCGRNNKIALPPLKYASALLKKIKNLDKKAFWRVSVMTSSAGLGYGRVTWRYRWVTWQYGWVTSWYGSR